jgi:protein-S-isoprenylcysteine O-methyltransferase Ste14
LFRALAKTIVWTAVIAVLIFVPAGTLDYPGAWVFIALFAGGGLAILYWLARTSPSLFRERLAPPIQRGQKPWDRVFMIFLVALFILWLPVMGWDAARSGFDAIPAWLQALGALFMIIYMAGAWWTFRENAFAAPVVKIQKDQRVIDTGPYGIVRHPMYTSALFLFLGVPLLLGSPLGLVFSATFVLAIAWRAVGEERMLRAELMGYDDYAARVRWRFAPYVW